jgi:predicted nucleic acid-binding protein
MSHAVRGALVVDTGVFGARLSPRGRSLALSYQPLLEGRATVISFVTVAELRFGAKLAGWGSSRFQHLEYERAELTLRGRGKP